MGKTLELRQTYVLAICFFRGMTFELNSTNSTWHLFLAQTSFVLTSWLPRVSLG